MTNESAPRWSHPGQIYAVLLGLLRHLRRRASAFDTRSEGWLYLAGLHLKTGSWRAVEDAEPVGEMPFGNGLVLVNQMLARLQELCWEPESRRVISNVYDRVSEVLDSLELDWHERPQIDADDDP